MAERLGCSVREAQRRIGEYEFGEWAAYGTLEPTIAQRLDWHFAALRADIANMFGGKDKTYEADDFLPEFGATTEEVVEKRGEKVAAKFGQIAQMLNQRDE